MELQGFQQTVHWAHARPHMARPDISRLLNLQKHLANYTVLLITSYWLMGTTVWLLRWIIMRHLYYYLKKIKD